ncbi:14353_t:CDS:1 [Racocetra persica]|uniref:14353_t:CDS:1 n=1 Tax=Racocetra persica TaxID=160502 RepID=A0ACA9PE76_9GLOM|nr:14353_t:CDS:1 [Racocetra persica]
MHPCLTNAEDDNSRGKEGLGCHNVNTKVKGNETYKCGCSKSGSQVNVNIVNYKIEYKTYNYAS